GTVSGGTLFGREDRVFDGLVSFLLTAEAQPKGGDILEGAYPSLILYGSLVVIGILVSYWAANSWHRIRKSAPVVSQFIAGGYGIDAAVSSGRRALNQASRQVDAVLDTKVWNGWLAGSLSWIIGKI